MKRHKYQAVHLSEGINAACSCGWVSYYTHAFDKYAFPDWQFHVTQQQPPTRRL